jgi:hypothetical protein
MEDFSENGKLAKAWKVEKKSARKRKTDGVWK